MQIERKVIITVKSNNGKMDIAIEFKPAFSSIEEWEKLNKEQKYLENYVKDIANHVIEALK